MIVIIWNRQHKNVLSIIKYPNIFPLFVYQTKKTDEISEIILLHTFLNERLYAPPYIEEKTMLVDNMLEMCELGKETNSVRKDKLFNSSHNTKLAYDILISYRIIYEYTIPNGLWGNITYVKFNHSNFFEYLLLLKWSKDRPMDINLFYVIKEYYKHNIQLRSTLLEMFVKVLVHENKTEIIDQLRAQIKTMDKEQINGNIISILDSVDG